MSFYWITFTDGTARCCEGRSQSDVARIATKLSGKEINGRLDWAAAADNENIQRLPYPSRDPIWLFDHPVDGKHPCFCMHPKRCAGMSSCPRGKPGFSGRSCDD